MRLSKTEWITVRRDFEIKISLADMGKFNLYLINNIKDKAPFVSIEDVYDVFEGNKSFRDFSDVTFNNGRIRNMYNVIFDYFNEWICESDNCDEDYLSTDDEEWHAIKD